MTRMITLIEIAPLPVAADPYFLRVPVDAAKLTAGGSSYQSKAALQKGTFFSIPCEAVGGIGPFTWSATGLPPGTSIDAVTGVWSGTSTGQGFYQPTITAVDTGNGGLATSTVVGITIDGAFAITGTLLPATANSGYAGNLIAVGATGAVTWSATGLPTGISINASTGFVTGNYTTLAGLPNGVPVSITATDAGSGSTVTMNLTFVVNRAIGQILWATTNSGTPPKLLAGATVSERLIAVDNLIGKNPAGTGPMTWTVTGLPAGLSVDNNGMLTGATQKDLAGSYTIGLSVVDAWGGTVSTSTTLVLISGSRAIGLGMFAVGDANGQLQQVDFYGAFFGDGSDGSVVCNGSNAIPGTGLFLGVNTAIRDLYLQNLTMATGGLLIMGKYKLYVAGALDVTAADANSIRAEQLLGGGPTSALGATGGANGAGATTGAAGAGGAGSSIIASMANSGGGTKGGAGGAGTSGAGGAGGNGSSVQKWEQPRSITPTFMTLDDINLTVTALMGGAAGGGGGGGGAVSGVGNGGGLGGGGGGRLIIYARTIVRGSATPASCISAKGGNAQNGGAGGVSGRGGSGGGAGGNGGAIWIAYASLVGTLPLNQWINADAGTSGNGGAAGGGAGVAGVGADGALGGSITIIDLGTPSSSVTFGSVGGAHSGVTAGTAGTCRQSI